MSTESSYPEEVQQLISMGYEPTVAQNAVEASGGNVEMALEILAGEQTQQEAQKTQEGQTAKAKQVVDKWSQQLLGDHHPQVKAKAQQASAGASSAWKKAMAKVKEADEKYQISSVTKEKLRVVDKKMKEFDEKHEVSSKVSKATSGAGSALNKTLQTAKKSLGESRQDGSVGGGVPGVESRN